MTAPLSLGGISLLTQMPILHQLFTVGPSFSPVPAKLVSQINFNQLVRSFFSALPYFILPFPASWERFAALSAAYPLDSLTVPWPGLVSVQLGFLRTCCCNEPHRLVNHLRVISMRLGHLYVLAVNFHRVN